jgi:hypothetical protein
MAKDAFKRESGEPLPGTGTALQRFLESMKIDYYKWHDGIGYDLDALSELNSSELNQVEDLLVSRKDSDWRDVEALAALNTPSSIQALKECLTSPDLECRLFAVRFLKEMNIEDHIEEVVVNTLAQTAIGSGLTYALYLAKTYPTEKIRHEVLRCALVGKDDIRVHCAAMSLFLYGKAKTDFDSNQKIVFEFHEKDLPSRTRVFERLCAIVGVDPNDLLT